MRRFIAGVAGLAVAAVALLAAAGPGFAGDDADRRGVEQAVLDYVEGVYEVDPERIRRSVHPELVKFGFARRSTQDDWRVIPMTFDQLVELAGTWNDDGSRASDDSPKKIEILDMLNQTAAAKLTAEWGVDYFHLAKYDGRWKIVHVLWQTLDD